jgi:hypothetical protein
MDKTCWAGYTKKYWKGTSQAKKHRISSRFVGGQLIASIEPLTIRQLY